MLSVLIPVYNFDIRDLVKNVCLQANAARIPFEIIVVDDASEEKYKQMNHDIASLKGVKYYEETVNIGRSKIRNKLAELARYDNLLFLDCDSAIKSSSFIQNYIDHSEKARVVYGGTIYNGAEKLNPDKRLHWLHGIRREQFTAEERNHQPTRAFKTNNFFIKKEVLQNILFNEKIKGYGHEDTLFGYELAKNNVSILHIDNPVIHLGLESSEEFLRKTREGIKNLKRIMKINGNEKKLVRDITLLAYYKKFKKLGLDIIVRYLYSKFEYRLRRNLLSSNPRLFVFDLYKLGYLCSLNGEIS